jgi:predicted house-cleaning NTP pyrophosphatase (Maf/HAM1 superfamily)
VQEFAAPDPDQEPELALQVARDVREYLQEIYQKIHGFNLTRSRATWPRPLASPRTCPSWARARDTTCSCSPTRPSCRSAGRGAHARPSGLAKRTSSIKKAQAGIEGFVPESMRRDFAIRMGYVVERWCDAKKPTCWECPLVLSCPFGKKVEREWKQSQRRLELQRARDGERQIKEAEKERKRAAAEEKRRLIAKAKDDAKRQREAERQKAKLAAKAAKKRPPRCARARSRRRRRASTRRPRATLRGPRRASERAGRAPSGERGVPCPSAPPRARARVRLAAAARAARARRARVRGRARGVDEDARRRARSARGRAHAGRAQGARGRRAPAEPCLCSGADTVVAVRARAARARCSASPHAARRPRACSRALRHAPRVVTGVCVVRADDRAFVDAERTWVQHARASRRARSRPTSPRASGATRPAATRSRRAPIASSRALEGGGFDNVVGLPVRAPSRCCARRAPSLAGAREPPDHPAALLAPCAQPGQRRR